MALLLQRGSIEYWKMFKTFGMTFDLKILISNLFLNPRYCISWPYTCISMSMEILHCAIRGSVGEALLLVELDKSLKSQATLQLIV